MKFIKMNEITPSLPTLSLKTYYIIKNFEKLSPLCVIFENISDAENFSNDINSLKQIMNKNINISFFMESDPLSRIKTLYQLKKRKCNVICLTKDAIFQNTFSLNSFTKRCLLLEINKSFPLTNLNKFLVDNGYLREITVEDIGQFSQRGEVIDLWSPNYDYPIRIKYSYEKIEEIKEIDIETQRTKSSIFNIDILPVNDITGKENIFQILSSEWKFCFAFDADNDYLQNIKKFGINLISTNSPSYYQSPLSYENNIKLLENDIVKWFTDNYKIYFFLNSESEAFKIENILKNTTLPKNFKPFVILKKLSQGIIDNLDKVVILTSYEFFGTKRKIISPPKFFNSSTLNSIFDIKENDYVIHQDYGIGIYKGLKSIVTENYVEEFIEIEFSGGDKLFVPINDFKKIDRYYSLGKIKPKISSIDKSAWERVKSRVKDGIEKFAKQLIESHAKRLIFQKQPYKKSEWEEDFENIFNYQLTVDQKKAIEDVMKDLENNLPMDRLIAGDVGFGKTEIALRSAFRVVTNNKQVAILVPTTLLAEQHYNTFTERFKPFPVEIAKLTSFTTEKEKKIIITKLKKGLIDIIIATHSILNNKIIFKNLGLLIIDEEHKFGVKQKEKIKFLNPNIDVLLLSATPIPRTLKIAMSGLKEISIIETPPAGRLPISTYVGIYNEKIIENAIENEIKRNGQIFYIHNKILTINQKYKSLKDKFPFLKIEIIHSKLPSHYIEETMLKFWNRKIDILLSTTIIEAGLNIPTVNTIIIEDAENFGLAQLYQLRGRVGREKQQAYCYFFYSKNVPITTNAKKRLEALRDFVSLGSGLRLAIRDLEIRGAGNLLGTRQHGYINQIGIELYSKLLKITIDKLENKETMEVKEPEIYFDIPQYIPEEIFHFPEERIMLYKRIFTCETTTHLDEIYEEINDKIGKIPQPIKNLFLLGELRLLAIRNKIQSIKQNNRHLEILFPATVNITEIFKNIKKYKDLKVEFGSSKKELFAKFKLKKFYDSIYLVKFTIDLLKCLS